MKTTFVIEIMGKPISKSRPKFYRRGNYVGTYDPQDKQKNNIAVIAQKYTIEKLNGKPIDGAIEVSIDCYFVPPKSVSKKQYDLMLRNKIRHIKRPDCTNIAKFYEDAFNGIVWRDDSQISNLLIRKLYGETDKVIITIISIKE